MEAATDATGIQRNELYNPRFNKNCKKVILEKCGAGLKCVQRRNRAHQENYNHKRKVANIIGRNEKKEWLHHKMKQIKDANKHRNVKI
jgi:hypothetical protein